MQATNKGITFSVAEVDPPSKVHETKQLASLITQHKVAKEGSIIKCTEDGKTLDPQLSNGFLGSAFMAYNEHYHLVLSPDTVWIAINVALASYIDRHAEEMRSTFVSHEGKKQLTVSGSGTISTANYDLLIDALSAEIDKNTKGDIREWVECDFSTSTQLTRTVSKIVLMGAMKNYFSYKMCLMCGLPKVTLLGTIDDWKKIRTRVDKLATFQSDELTHWSTVLGSVLDHFVDAFDGNIDKDWWNSIAHRTGGGSGPRYLEGWILAFSPWNDAGHFVLDTVEQCKKGIYGRMNTVDVPSCAVQVPVTIDDNGVEYKTNFYAGLLSTQLVEADTLAPNVGWVLIDSKLQE
eukprot:TRINITY_DN407_c0_g1_i1.p1 TRINITY_DN407_c0_g1~~TRINITY_DN407_c0_g1_i1.p1  ORF type:complete len:349 (-),score=57.76 TRINITY_DN407_c0_g1_i1:87-1133(-)